MTTRSSHFLCGGLVLLLRRTVGSFIVSALLASLLPFFAVQSVEAAPVAKPRLKVSISGAPAAGVRLQVKGPGGKKWTLKKTRTLPKLKPGKYTLKASKFTYRGFVYSPKRQTTTVRTSKNKRVSTVKVAFTKKAVPVSKPATVVKPLIQVPPTDPPPVVQVPPNNVQYASAIGGQRQIAVSWQAPAPKANAPITSYIVKRGGMTQCVGTQLSCSVTGLADNTNYQIEIAAQGPGGTSSSVFVSAKTLPALVAPSAPRLVRAIGSASTTTTNYTVSWETPTVLGDGPITYTAKTLDGTKTCTTTATSCLLGGITSGTQTKVTVTATNSGGTSPASTQAPLITAIYGRAFLTGTGANTKWAVPGLGEISGTPTLEYRIRGDVGAWTYTPYTPVSSTAEVSTALTQFDLQFRFVVGNRIFYSPYSCGTLSCTRDPLPWHDLLTAE